MLSTLFSENALNQYWKVLVLFLIPIGGGIPAGVLLAKTFVIEWPVTMILYLVSDIILACLFEPLLLLFIAATKKIPALEKVSIALKQNVKKITSYYGSSMGPLTLILISFGADPMTGRTAAISAGHGFFAGWVIAITGDMLYFILLMVSTLWLNSIIGDGTSTTLIILGLMMIVPIVIKQFRKSAPV